MRPGLGLAIPCPAPVVEYYAVENYAYILDRSHGRASMFVPPNIWPPSMTDSRTKLELLRAMPYQLAPGHRELRVRSHSAGRQDLGGHPVEYIYRKVRQRSRRWRRDGPGLAVSLCFAKSRWCLFPLSQLAVSRVCPVWPWYYLLLSSESKSLVVSGQEVRFESDRK